MDPITRYCLVLVAVMTALGAMTSFAIAWELRGKRPGGPPAF